MHTPDLERMDATLYKYDTTGVCIERARIYFSRSTELARAGMR